MRVDVNAFLGAYAFRPGSGSSPLALVEAMDRTGIDTAWISNLSALFSEDPSGGNAVLYDVARREARLHPIPAVHPGLPDWLGALERAAQAEVPCVRADPTYYGLEPAGSAMRALAAACGERGLPLLLAVRLEDQRQRDPRDTAPELQPWHIRMLLRSDPRLRLLVTHADKDFIEQVHFGSTPAEAARILWDICWIWGPPEDHLEQLLRTVGVPRFTFGTGMPLRIPEASVAKLDLLDLATENRQRIESGNLGAFLAREGPRGPDNVTAQSPKFR